MESTLVLEKPEEARLLDEGSPTAPARSQDWHSLILQLEAERRRREIAEHYAAGR